MKGELRLVALGETSVTADRAFHELIQPNTRLT